MTKSNKLTELSDNLARATGIGSWIFWLAVFTVAVAASPRAHAAGSCADTIKADVVVFDSPTVFNRLGAQNPNWITYALKRDIVDKSNKKPCSSPDASCLAGGVELRPDKRPRPLVIRSVAGSCLEVTFTNLLDPKPNPNQPIAVRKLIEAGELPDTFRCDDPNNPDNANHPACALDNNDQVAGRCAGFHATGTELVNSIRDDGSLVGANDEEADVTTNCTGGETRGGLVGPGQSITYTLHTPEEGAYIINNYGSLLGSESSSGNTAVGMFGALNVQPEGARIYRSQVTEEEMRLATVGTVPSDCKMGDVPGVDCNPGGQPILDYEKTYPDEEPWRSEGKAGLPVLNMIDPRNNELVHSDINAIIAGPNPDGTFPPSTYPLESVGHRNPQLPNRLEPFREFTSVFHDEQTNSQVFPKWYNDPVLGFTLAGVKDQFMINYGSGGIGSEIIANRLHTGPMHDCTDCAYEEFFLSSSTVGDPALLVNYPANTGIEQCDPTNFGPGGDCWRNPTTLANGPVAFPDPADPTGKTMKPVENYALYQEDPSNVHHAYTGDFTKVRNTHTGSFEQHIFHLHNHQWLFNPNDDNANYLDAQEIMPGSGHTYELVNGGVGNRNKTTGDAIFHCHFYPHFAQGMWYHIRIMDVMETGSVLAVSGGTVDQPGYHKADRDGDGFVDWELRSGKPAQGARALPDGELPDGVPIPAIVPLPGKPLPQMPAKVQVAAVDRGSHSLLGGRGGPDGIPDSSQVFVDRKSVAGPDTVLGTADDRSPGYPFWLAGNECGPDGVIDPDGNPATIDAQCPRGIVGQRMPTPPLDMLTEDGAVANGYSKGQAGGWDGGLPRHSLLGYVSGAISEDTQNRLDFRKVVHMAPPVYFPEAGTDLEQVSMQYQARRVRPSAAVWPDGTVVGEGDPNFGFVMNGAPPVPGGPYNDPCVDDNGIPLTGGHVGNWFDGAGGKSILGNSEYDGETPRTYRVANIQIDAVFNKVGYHYPQERIIALWGDVEPTINKQRPPEPLVMRFNTFDCGKILHANLVPHEYEIDDFQVRTPTDIIGQHIHLPKWDLTTNDGAANGWNYEDGTLSPGMVRERILAINEYNHLVHECKLDSKKCVLPPGYLGPYQFGPIDLNGLKEVPTLTLANGADPGSPTLKRKSPYDDLAPAKHPYFGTAAAVNPQTNAEHIKYLGARTTIQRLMIDPVVNVAGVDRGLGLTFSHDHYGPSTFQQIGLYSTILAEPAGSTWKHNESGEELYGRSLGLSEDYCTAANCTDGGPTSWQAMILTPDTDPKTEGKQNPVPDHREFYFEMSDFQHAYEPGVYVAADEFGIPKLLGPSTSDATLRDSNIFQPQPFNATLAYADSLQDTWTQAVNPPMKLKSVPFPDIVTADHLCPGPADTNGDGILNEDDKVDGNFVATNVSPFVPRPCVEAINISHSSMWVSNYRNEPVALRVFDPDRIGPDGQDGAQALGDKGDLALAFQSRTDRVLPQLNTSLGDTPYPTPSYCDGPGDGINCDRRRGDPYTPIMRAYENDHVKVKVQVGATEEQHQISFHGMKWLSNGSGFGQSPNSGWRNFQSTGISEQFSLQMPVIPDRNQRGNTVDYLYGTDVTRDGIWSGTWGVLRSYATAQKDLPELPDNSLAGGDVKFVDESDFSGVCPKYEMDADGNILKDGKGKRATPREVRLVQYDVAAVLANKVLGKPADVVVPSHDMIDPQFPTKTFGDQTVGGSPDPDGGTLVYNRRTTVVPTLGDQTQAPGVLRGGAGPLNDPTAMMYVRLEDLKPRWIEGVSPDYEPAGGDGIDDRCQKFKDDGTWNTRYVDPECPLELKPNVPVEPLILRANAGDCIEVTVHNKFLDQARALSTSEDSVNGVASSNPAIWYYDNGVKKSLFEKVEYDKLVQQGKTFETGDGIPVAAEQIVFDQIPDLAGWQDVFWVVNRDMFNGDGTIKPLNERRQDDQGNAQMHFFNNNLIAPSKQAGIHAQLVEYDMSRDDGVVVGQNQQSTVAGPRAQHTYRYYAGHIHTEFLGVGGKGKKTAREFRRTATPIEFGGTNLLSADRVKQPQKGLYGALVIEPKGATWPDALDELEDVADNQGTGMDTRKTRAQVTVNEGQAQGADGDGGEYRENISVTYRIANLRWQDGTAVSNIHQGELGREGAEDSGHAGYNYAAEPSWFRFQLPPDAEFGNAKAVGSFGELPNVHAFYANGLAIPLSGNCEDNNCVPAMEGISKKGDPATPVYRAVANTPTRIHVLNGASADRDATFILHGHVWQRDPFVCPGDNHLGLPGLCDPSKVPSRALGRNPLGKAMGGEEGMGHVFGHWPILFDAGGSFGVPGDYLYRDYGPSGNRNGMFGILRVSPDPNDSSSTGTSSGGGT